MSKIINRSVRLGEAGLVQGTTQGPWEFIYRVSTVKDSKWNVGDSVELPNGKKFVYCKSGDVCYTGQGNKLMNAIPATGIDYALLAKGGDIGAISIQMTAVLEHTENDLAGGNIVLKPVSGSSNAVLQQRIIVGNSAASIGGAVTIHLDAPLTAALTTASYGFCMPSPYSNVNYSSNNDTSVVGPAATYVSAANMYFWCQYAGRCWIAPNENNGLVPGGSTVYGREVVWRHDGTVQLRLYSSAAGGAYGQVAGYIMDNNSAQNGSTEIMLTGNV